MKKYVSQNIRNIALVGHKSAGKTSMAEALLFTSQTTTRLGSVDAKTSIFDFDSEEIERRMTISSSVGAIEWKKHKINIIDTPGDSNFIFDAYLSMSAADAVVVVVSAPDGMEVQTVRAWERALELNIPCVFFINKMERERADPNNVITEMRKTLSADIVPIQLPIGRENAFKGVVDVLSTKACVYDKNASGKFTYQDVPQASKDEIERVREALIEKIAESSDELTEKYLEKEGLTHDEIARGFSEAVKTRMLFPVLYGSAIHNIGVQQLMNFIVDYLPNPIEGSVWQVIDSEKGKATRARRENEPFLAFVFKTCDAQGGIMSIFRVLAGCIESDAQVLNPNAKVDERIGSLLVVTGKKTEQVQSIPTGDIAGVLKLKNTSTGQSLCDKNAPVRFLTITPPEPCISYALKPKTKGDEDKLGISLNRMLIEDPTLRLMRHQDTKDFLLAGVGAPHIEISVARMKRRYGVEVDVEIPRVPYRETITEMAQSQGRYKRQTGGRGQFGNCWLELTPLPRGEKFEFVNRIKGGAIPAQFIPAVEKGVIDTMEKGQLAGFPVVDVKVAVYDGSYHEVDSSEIAFKRAASIAFRAAMEKANPILLEPVYKLEIIVPEEFMGDIMGDLNSKRGRVMGMETKNKQSIIKAQVPQAEILMYSPELDSRTGGRGSFTMEFSHYQPLPTHLVEKVIARYGSTHVEET